MATWINSRNNYQFPKPCYWEYGQLKINRKTCNGFLLFFDTRTEAMRTEKIWRVGYPKAEISLMNTYVKTGHHSVFIPATCFPEMGAI